MILLKNTFGSSVGYDYIKYTDNTGYLFRKKYTKLLEIMKIYFYNFDNFVISNNRLTTLEMQEANGIFSKYFDRAKMAKGSHRKNERLNNVMVEK